MNLQKLVKGEFSSKKLPHSEILDTFESLQLRSRHFKNRLLRRIPSLAVYCKAYVTPLISQRKKRPTENDSIQHEKAVSSLCALPPVPYRNRTPIKKSVPRANAKDSRRRVALRNFLKINYYMTKDIFGQKPIGGEAINCKPWKVVQILSWWHRQTLT